MEPRIQYAQTKGVGKVPPGHPAFEEDNLARAHAELKKGRRSLQ